MVIAMLPILTADICSPVLQMECSSESAGDFMRQVPDEILLEIFQFMTVEELVNCIQNVSLRWRNVSQDTKLWKNVAYKPASGTTDEEIIRLLKQMPRLKTFIFNNFCTDADKIVDVLCAYCKELSTIICDGITMTESHLGKLLSKLPNLENLKLSQWQMVNELSLIILGQFRRLRKLTCVNVGPGSLYLINNFRGFLPLEHLEVKAYCTEEALSEGNWHASHFLYLIPSFKNLSHLSVDFRMLHFSSFESVFEGICELKNLKFLRLRSLFHSNKDILGKTFNAGPLLYLEIIDLSHSLNVNLKAVQAVCRNCPAVREMHFSRCVYFDDDCATALAKCQNLRLLDLSCCNRVSERGLAALSRCPKLESLDISWRGNVPWHTLEVLCTFPLLKGVILNHTEIMADDILELLTRNSRIVYLSLYCCVGVDVETLQTLVPHCKINSSQWREIPCPGRSSVP